MAYDVALAVFIVGVNLAFSHSDPTINGGDMSLRKVCRRKCPAGYFSYCTPGGTSRCVSCERGVTYSMYRSRRTSCRLCSRCRDNEFEAEPCTLKKDVVCQKCSDCPPGFGVRSLCARKLDTVCEPCPVGTVSDEYSAVKTCQPCPIYKERKLYSGGGEGKEHRQPKNETNGAFQVSLISEDRNRSLPVGESKEFSVQVVEKPDDVMQPTGSDVSVVETHEHSSRLPSVTPLPSSSYSGNHTSTPNLKELTSISGSLDRLDSTQSSSVYGSVVTLLQESVPVSRLLPAVWSPVSRVPNLKTRHMGEPHNQPWTKNNSDDSKHARRHAEDRILVKSQVHDLKTKSLPNLTLTAGTKLNAPQSNFRDEESTEFQATLKAQERDSAYPATKSTKSSKQIATWFIGVIVAVLVLFTGLAVFIFHLQRRKNYPANGTTGSSQLRCPHSSDCCDGNSVASLPEVVLNENQCPTVTSNTETEETVASNPTLHTYVSDESRSVTADIHEPNKRSVFQVFNIDPEKQSSSLGSNPVPEEAFTAYAHGIFSSTGGYLKSTHSNVHIHVPPGAVQEGVSQPIFFGVVFDETPLLKTIPETSSEKTLISPVIKCGPSDLTILKPVEIVLPHCLYIEDTKKASITVFHCGKFSDNGPIWESVPLATEKTSQSMAWFTIKKDTIHIRTKCFSFWSVFACGGPKRKRAAVFASRPSLESKIIYLRFYIYSDTADSSRKVVEQDKQSFPDSKRCTKEKPFKMFSDNREIEVKLTQLEDGWILDKTPNPLVYSYQSAYNNGDFRVRDSCDFAVKPTHNNVEPFSCIVSFQQDDHPPKHEIYLNTGMKARCSFQNNNTSSSVTSSDEASDSESRDNSRSSKQAVPRVRFQLDFCPEGSDSEPVTERHCHCIVEKVGVDWKRLLRELGIEEFIIRNVDAENREVNEKCFQGLIRWKNSSGSEATTRRLCQALQDIRRRDVIEHLVAEGLLPEPGTAIQESSACTNTTI